MITLTVAGALGAVCRYLLTGWVQRISRSEFPFGTLLVNLSGGFAVGLVAGVAHPESVASLAAFGFLGGFTTYSTWMVETLRLGPTIRLRGAPANLLLTLIGGILFAAAGFAMTH